MMISDTFFKWQQQTMEELKRNCSVATTSPTSRRRLVFRTLSERSCKTNDGDSISCALMRVAAALGMALDASVNSRVCSTARLGHLGTTKEHTGHVHTRAHSTCTRYIIVGGGQ
eukprot:TRINITY_DN13575_c0_g3_i1.p1 TRINITY_DN13575_c0_g3~~TRINITY_DN13575_c0_g3_i1.p1  ORF type:complete len:114 (-),score=8.13 TRINITY_DN13575_c0_g3_i1:348-689(-)